MIFFLESGLALTMVLLLLSWLLSWGSFKSVEKKTPFECGFEPLSDNRTPFSTRFFVILVLFLVFDVEVALLFPFLASSFQEVLIPSVILVIVFFLLILLAGLFHEWNEGCLEWMED
uniref:NADH-ubiquinone oxidoreductase chain 3 n=1 Tax=Imerinia grandidieri TaxID=3244470 RepID=G8HQY0_9EUPU|nr:NADH dehydrogenase subunit 3 [Rhopalocaulis grandidieri]